MTNKDAIAKLHQLSACSEAVKWCAGRRVAAAWRECERGDWMLWLCGRLSGKPGSKARRKLVLCACECARLSLQFVPAGELRPLRAIETAERWARGDRSVTLDDVRSAAAASDFTLYYGHPTAIYDAACAARACASAAHIVYAHSVFLAANSYKKNT